MKMSDPTAALKEVMKEMAGKGKGKSSKPGKPRTRAARAEPQKCGCGCGKMTKGGKFLPGHDSKLHSRLLKAAKEGDNAAKAELRKHGW